MNRTTTIAVCVLAAGLLTFSAINSQSQGRVLSTSVTRVQTPAPQSPTSKSNLLKLLRGTHGYSYSGSVMGLAIAASGPITFDGAGNLEADYTVSLGGEIFQGSFFGSYTVEDDATGTVTIDLPLLGVSSHGTFVLVNNGKETFFTGTDPGVIVTGLTKKQK